MASTGETRERGSAVNAIEQAIEAMEAFHPSIMHTPDSYPKAVHALREAAAALRTLHEGAVEGKAVGSNLDKSGLQFIPDGDLELQCFGSPAVLLLPESEA